MGCVYVSDLEDFLGGGESEDVPVSAFFEFPDLVAEEADPDLPA